MTTCSGGEFDGYTLTTDRDRQLCVQGGGRVEGGTSGGCGAATIRAHAVQAGGQASIDPLLNATTSFPESAELELLRELATIADPLVSDVLGSRPELAARLVGSLELLGKVANRVLDDDFDGAPLTAEDFEELSAVAREVAEHASEPDVRTLIEKVVEAGTSYVDVASNEVRERLGARADLSSLEPSLQDFQLHFPSPDLHEHHRRELVRPGLTTSLREELTAVDWLEIIREREEAERAIAEKARGLGALTELPLGDVRPISGGYLQRFRDCDILWSPGSGAHEIHGDIRQKYWHVNGPSRLGFPTTDESGCPDGRGRYNHFTKNASIYWSPTTGPFWLAGAVRFRWASEGWEAGRLGYPTQDQESLPAMSPNDNPDLHWSHFQHGMISSHHGNAQVALAATVTARQIADSFYRQFDRRMTAKTYKVGLVSATVRPGLYGVDVLGVDDTSYDFWATIPRTLRLKVRGFVSLPVVSDPTWEMELHLRFGTDWPMGFTFPSSKTVLAALVWSRVSVSGVMSSDIHGELRSALAGAFNVAGPLGPSMVLAAVPTGAQQTGQGNLDFLDVMLAADGSLGVYVNAVPEIPGKFRQLIAQRALDAAIEG